MGCPSCNLGLLPVRVVVLKGHGRSLWPVHPLIYKSQRPIHTYLWIRFKDFSFSVDGKHGRTAHNLPIRRQDWEREGGETQDMGILQDYLARVG